MGYNLKNIRTLLTEGFTDEELRRLCYDVPNFRPVYDQLAWNTGKAQIIDRLIEYAERTLQLDALLALVKENNPARYEQHQPYDDIGVSSAVNNLHGKSPRNLRLLDLTRDNPTIEI